MSQMRTRVWRRWRSDIKIKKINRRAQFNLRFWKKYYQGSSSYIFRYDKRNSITEVVEVEIQCQSHFIDYLNLNNKKLRDNPKKCSCWFCCNPRKAHANSKKALSLSELRFFESLNYQKKHDD